MRHKPKMALVTVMLMVNQRILGLPFSVKPIHTNTLYKIACLKYVNLCFSKQNKSPELEFGGKAKVLPTSV